jgi:transposase
MATTTAHHPSASQHRDFKRMERLRLGAARMFEQGTSQAEVAHRLGTSRQNTHRWHHQWRHSGRAALRAAGRAGRKPKLDARARRKLERALLQGALAHGFDSDLWTCKRVVIVIERLTGVRHHPSHAWRILRAMGWTLQRPERRATERDEQAIARWVKWLVFLDESGVGFTPPVRRTWAPRGQTPILRHRQRNWSRLSMAAMCCYRPNGSRARLALHLQPGSYNDDVLIGVLQQLRRFLNGQKATLLWDGLRSHWSRPMRAFIASQRGWLVVERLPGYAPELNPVEGVWSNLKGQEFANYAADTMDDLAQQARRGATRVRRRPRLLFAFLDRTGLSL